MGLIASIRIQIGSMSNKSPTLDASTARALATYLPLTASFLQADDLGDNNDIEIDVENSILPTTLPVRVCLNSDCTVLIIKRIYTRRTQKIVVVVVFFHILSDSSPNVASNWSKAIENLGHASRSL